MRWPVAAVLLLLLMLVPVASAEGEGADLSAVWDTASPILLSTPDSVEAFALAAEDVAVFFAEWGAELGGEGVGNVLGQLPYPLCC